MQQSDFRDPSEWEVKGHEACLGKSVEESSGSHQDSNRNQDAHDQGLDTKETDSALVSSTHCILAYM